MSHDEMLMEDRTDRCEWAWATEHAAPEWASTVQLVSWLARGELPPHTLVWKPGWGEWLPALQVAELADAFPRVTAGSRRVARVAFDAAVTPPPVPVAQYPRLRLLAKDVIRDSSLPQVPAVEPRFGLPPEQTLVKYRDADHAQQELVTKQVPAAAMLEAAQAMQALDTAAKPGTPSRWSGLALGTFGETTAPTSMPLPSAEPPRSLTAVAVEVGSPALSQLEARDGSRRTSRGYGRWISLGALAGAALGLLSARDLLPPAALFTVIRPLSSKLPAALTSLAQPATPAEPAAPAATAAAAAAAAALPAAVPPSASALPPAVKPPPVLRAPPGRIRVSRSGEPAALQALRVTKNDGFDRVVLEFRERVPGYRIEYTDKPARDCDSGQARRVEGDGRLELRLFPARAHDESGEPTYRPRELKPGLGMIRELERTCDRNDVVTWVIGTASPQRYRAYELAEPPRLVIQIEH